MVRRPAWCVGQAVAARVKPGTARVFVVARAPTARDRIGNAGPRLAPIDTRSPESRLHQLSSAFGAEVLMWPIFPSPSVAILLGSMLAIAPPLSAQSARERTPEQIKASYDAHRAEFDYLLGDWEFSSVSREYGNSSGYWSAVRLAEGQILDEYRIVGDSGQTYYVTTTLRAFNAVLDRWELVGMDAGMGLQDVGTAQRVGAEMHIEQRFGVMSRNPSIWRIRYHDIRQDRFSWTADRSTDGGKTWERNHLQIEARRIGPPRSMGPLAIPKKAGGTGSGFPPSGHDERASFVPPRPHRAEMLSAARWPTP